jgi:pimeloyl-ACP methyl ester carboxylesterase
MELTPYHPFRSAEARDQYLAEYDRRAQRWPVPSEPRMVATSYGQTFVRVSGPADAPPLVLLHGTPANSLMWQPMVAALSTHHRVYAVDTIWDIGRSVYTRPLKGPMDYLNWLDGLFSALAPATAINLVGMSHGGWLSGLYAVRFPKRVAKAVLLSPSGTVRRLRMTWLICAIASGLHRSLGEGFKNWMFKDSLRLGPDARQLVEEIMHDGAQWMRILVRTKMVPPTVLTDKELQGLSMPVLVLLGENEKIYSPRKALRRLQKVAPHIKAELIPHAGHDLVLAQTEVVNRYVIDFLNQP